MAELKGSISAFKSQEKFISEPLYLPYARSGKKKVSRCVVVNGDEGSLRIREVTCIKLQKSPYGPTSSEILYDVC